MLLFVAAAGFAVLFATLAASLDERFHEGASARAGGRPHISLNSSYSACSPAPWRRRSPGGVLIRLAGYFGTRRVVIQSPLTILREL